MDEELGDLRYYLSQYNFKAKYNPGKCSHEADCLSRNLVLECYERTDEMLKVVHSISPEDIKMIQLQILMCKII